ncbi:hypothetical protein LTR62_000632 [Meristemomyces frigidus]|uniref:Probable glucan endo-1,3-beta-glucosidase eglC n=1 Tax=Meristemomyces frigidus TaxID=1508187 RepID=A0AAN7YC38_9PEZI|nr:hypothetical protein LTR62_000632 [Meristemomyces frigidus]
MKYSLFHAALSAASTASAAVIGFNYGNTFTNGAVKAQSDYEAEFNAAKALAGTNGDFTSARLYTMIQGGTTDTPIAAIPAAIDTKTTLLLGMWASSGQADFTNELTALTSAIKQYGTAFTDLIVGISVGSEDLYRNSPTGIAANTYNEGADPDVIVSFISQTRAAIAGTVASGASVGHVDTWTAYVNGSNSAVISACDWLGMDAYPYFQNTIANSIDLGNTTFFEAYDNTIAVAQGKSVWVTETGWPVSGPQENQAVASVANAQTYWSETGCALFGNINTWWYVLQDAAPTTPSPSFGIVGSNINSAPLYNLSCPAFQKSAASSSASASSSAVKTASSASAPASSAGPNTESLSNAAPAPETSPVSATLSPSSAKSTAASVAMSTTVSAMTTGTVTTIKTGVMSTIYQTTLVTITSCSSGCTSTATMPAASMSSAMMSSAMMSSAKSASPAPMSSAESASPAPASSSAVTPAAPSGTACPANLNGAYQYPHLIVPVNSAMPDKAYGTQYNATITPEISTVFNFDLPQSYAGKTCSLVFLFPEQAALETSAYTFNGQGGITVGKLSAPATAQSTYNSVAKEDFHPAGSIASLKPGNSYVVSSYACEAGATVAFEFESTGGLDLEYFEDYNPSPLGAYITVC